MWRTWKHRAARWLLRDSALCLVHADALADVGTIATEIHDYCQRSGALQQPPRVKASRRLRMLAVDLLVAAEQAAAGRTT